MFMTKTGLAFFLILINLAINTGLWGVELPLYVTFASDNHLDYYPQREVKEIVWDEKYRIALGMEELRKGDFSAEFRLTSRSDFIQQQVLIDRLTAAYHFPLGSFSATTRTLGVGSGYYHQEQYVASPDYDNWLYGSTRFNGLMYGFDWGKQILELGLGGNVHNQAMAVADYRIDLSQPVRIGFRLDSSARDTHWNTPQLMGSVYYRHQLPWLELTTDLAYKHVFPYQETPLKQEYFGVAELALGKAPLPKLILSARYEDRDHAPQQQLMLQAALKQGWGRFSFCPGWNYWETDGDSLWHLNLLVGLKLTQQSRIGIYYQYEEQAQSRHSFGLQSSLRLDF